MITAKRGGLFRETLALTQAYVEAHKQHGQSELIDELVSSRPDLDHTHYSSPEELKAAGLKHLHSAIELLQQQRREALADECRTARPDENDS